MKRLNSLILISLLSASNVLAQVAEENQQQQEQVLRARITQFVDDVNEANGEGFVDTFSDKLYPPSAKEGIIKSVKQRASIYDIHYEIHLKDVKVDRKMAYEEGWYRSVLIPKDGGEPVIQEYDFLDVWELEDDGKWRIVKALKTERLRKEYKEKSELSGEFSQIAGSYRADDLAVEIKVTQNNIPVLIVSDRSPIELLKSGSYTYDLKGVSGAELTFEVGDGGIAEKAIMKQVTGEVVAIRIR